MAEVGDKLVGDKLEGDSGRSRPRSRFPKLGSRWCSQHRAERATGLAVPGDKSVVAGLPKDKLVNLTLALRQFVSSKQSRRVDKVFLGWGMGQGRSPGLNI